MIEWYKDKNLAVSFSITPLVAVRYCAPYTDKKEKEDIEKYPFICKNSIDVVLCDYVSDEIYEFTIPEGYKWDGATIPRIFWRLIGPKTDNRFLIPSLIHDVLCENHGYVNNDRYFADRVFERLLYVSGVNSFNRWMMFHSVDNFQKFCGWNKNSG